MKETYCYSLVRKLLKSRGRLIKWNDHGTRFSQERADFIYGYNGETLIIEVKVQRTKKLWNPENKAHLRPSQKEFLEQLRRDSGWDVEIWVYKHDVRHPTGAPDFIWRLRWKSVWSLYQVSKLEEFDRIKRVKTSNSRRKNGERSVFG